MPRAFPVVEELRIDGIADRGNYIYIDVFKIIELTRMTNFNMLAKAVSEHTRQQSCPRAWPKENLIERSFAGSPHDNATNDYVSDL